VPWNLLILPLVGGYYIFTRCHYFKYIQQRLDRQRLIFDTIITGVVLLFITVILRSIVEWISIDFVDSLYSFLPVHSPFLGTACVAFFFAIAGSHLANWLFFRDTKAQINRAIELYGSELELLLRDSNAKQELLLFTLDTDKFYIAWVQELPIPNVSSSIKILPAFSGYRTNKKELEFTTQYLSVYAQYVEEGKIQRVDELDTKVVIPTGRIVSVSSFDIEMFDRFNAVEDEAPF
jgi:hypothetical protein